MSELENVSEIKAVGLLNLRFTPELGIFLGIKFKITDSYVRFNFKMESFVFLTQMIKSEANCQLNQSLLSSGSLNLNIGTFNILHAGVSYIINIACHWTFFPNITSFSNVLERQNPDFFSPIFQLPIFAKPYRQTYLHQCRGLITWLKHAISPYFGIVWVLFYNI